MTAVLEQLRFFLSYLQQMGLVVNMDKTQFLLHVSGNLASKVLAKYMSRKHGHRYLRLSESLTPEVSATTSYLGVQLRWRKSADATLTHRLTCGVRSFAVLLPWWRSTLTRHLKVRLFVNIVLPSIIYGLSAVGISTKGRQELQTTVLRYIRRLMRSPSHLSHETDQSLLQRLHLLPPCDKVTLGSCRLVRRTAITLNAEVCPSGMLSESLAVHQASDSIWWCQSDKRLRLRHGASAFSQESRRQVPGSYCQLFRFRLGRLSKITEVKEWFIGFSAQCQSSINQASIAHSSAESELYAMTQAAVE